MERGSSEWKQLSNMIMLLHSDFLTAVDRQNSQAMCSTGRGGEDFCSICTDNSFYTL